MFDGGGAIGFVDGEDCPFDWLALFVWIPTGATQGNECERNCNKDQKKRFDSPHDVSI